MNKTKAIATISLTGFAIMLILAVISRSPLQSSMDIPYIQAKKIDHMLMENNINYKQVQPSARKGLSGNVRAYDITDETGQVYLLLLDSFTNSFDAVLTSDNELVFGLVDSTMGLGDISQISHFQE